MTLQDIPQANGCDYLIYPYAKLNHPTEEEILHKESLGYRLFKWEKAILERVKLRRALYAQQQHCEYCKKELTFEESTLDHKLALSKGGLDSLDNLVISCDRCNVKKGSLSVEEFAATDFGLNMPLSKRAKERQNAIDNRKRNYLNFQIMYFLRSPLC